MANVDHFFILTGDLAVANGSHPASDNSPSGRICTRVECLLCQTTHTVTRKTTEAATTLRPIAARPISTHFVTRSVRHPGDELHIVSPVYTHFVTLCTSSPG